MSKRPQSLGYLVVNGEHIPVLRRAIPHAVQLKMRRGISRDDETYLKDESRFLSSHAGYKYLRRLKEGQTITL